MQLEAVPVPRTCDDAVADQASRERAAIVRAGSVGDLKLAIDVEDRVPTAVVPDNPRAPPTRRAKWHERHIRLLGHVPALPRLAAGQVQRLLLNDANCDGAEPVELGPVDVARSHGDGGMKRPGHDELAGVEPSTHLAQCVR